MTKSEFQNWAEEIASKRQFKIDDLIYEGEYYAHGSVRNLIYSGSFSGTPAVFKIYDDPRFTDEPISLRSFLKYNQSKKLIAPELYDYEMITPNKGWLIMEKLPADSKAFQSPLSSQDRSLFLDLFLEYRQNFLDKPTRKLVLVEQLPAHEFHTFRMQRWLELANRKELEIIHQGGKHILIADEFIPRFLKAHEIIRKEFAQRKMIWCHGHFKPQEIFYSPAKNIYYLTDFAHTHLFPEGYEFAFIIWADYLMRASWQAEYDEWKKGIVLWTSELNQLMKKLNYSNSESLLKASILERVIGTILADICATDKPRDEKEGRIILLYKLIDELSD